MTISKTVLFAVGILCVGFALVIASRSTQDSSHLVTAEQSASMSGRDATAKSPLPSSSTVPFQTSSRTAINSPSKAPWAEGVAALERRDYATLIAAARSSPSTGSYILAARALSGCINVLGNKQKILSSIESDAENAAARRKAFEALERPCTGLGSLDELIAQRDALFKEAGPAGDAIEATRDDIRKLADLKQPHDERQAKLSKILSLEDADAFNSLTGTLATKGATFDGVPVKEADLGTYRIALQMAGCELYKSACLGPNSTTSLTLCARHADCDGHDLMTGYQRSLPPAMYEKAGNLYFKIRDRLARGDYATFGLP